MILAITELCKSSITVDGNHHLAGQDLNRNNGAIKTDIVNKKT